MSFPNARLNRCLSLLLVLVVGTGCVAPRSATPGGPPASTQEERASEAEWTAPQVHRALEEASTVWAGVPYRLGGTTAGGVDCSALVQRVYANHFSVMLPRTTDQQVRLGERVEPHALQPGDLLFFRPERGVRHSGIYLSDGRFLHASTSSGVRISPLDTRYWQERWWQARRILPTFDEAPPPPVSRRPASSDRAGW